MLYLLHGTNSIEARKKLHSLTKSLLSKKPNASEFRIDDENFSEAKLEEFIQSSGLFENKYIVVIDGVLEKKEVKTIILKKLKEISKSENIFIFLDGKIDKTTLSRFKKWAEGIQEFNLSEEVKKKPEFNIFSITDAFGGRDNGKTWVLYQKGKLFGITPEEIHGILLWQLKNLILVKEATNPKSLGLNPFVLRKTSSFVENYKREELRKLSEKLVFLYHDARRGIVELDLGLEKFILGI
jgi:DNA polymerase III delta subunit